MLSYATEKSLAKITGFGMALVIVFLVNGTVTDPVNVTKLFILGIVSFAAIGCVLKYLPNLITQNRFIFTIVGLFILSSIFVLVMGSGSFTQSFYGSYGRNNGFLAYFCLATLFFVSTLFRKEDSFKTLIHGLLLAGLVNLVYCQWVITFGDPISWSNPYNTILGTFGNPNFIGAFLGIFAPAYFCFALSPNTTKAFKWSAAVVVPLALLHAYLSNAIQGRIVALTCFAVIGFYFIRSRSSSAAWIYSGLLMVVGIFAIAGALQKGPLTEIIYKTSVSLRGQYWLAAFNTGKEHLWTGVGFDFFGDWYRRMRDPQALILPGPNITVNAAHNIPLDFFAFGGIPLLLTYLALVALVIKSLIRTTIKRKNYDPLFVTLVIVWVGYQLQSLISINQIGLAIIGWVFGGAIIAYDCMQKSEIKNSNSMEAQKVRRKGNVEFISAPLLAGIGALTGALIAIPPMSADMRWRSAMVNNSLPLLEKTLQPSYLSPQNTNMYGIAIESLERSKLYDYAHKYNLEALKFNRDSFDLWRLLYFLNKSTDEEKQLALKNMRRLDPLNENVLQ